MKQLIFITTILLSLLCFGCGENNNDPLQGLEGARWKLVGIVDETGLKELGPKDCKECYTLVFDTDTSIVGKSSSNILSGNYEIDYETNIIFIHCGPNTYMGEHPNGYLYIEILNKVQSFSLQRNELRLHYNDNKNYLLYKIIRI